MGVKKEKALSAEQLAKKEAKRLKEIAKLEKEKNKSRGIGYFAFFLFIITVVYMVDEVTSQIGPQMQTIIATEIFAPIVGEEFAVARMSAFGITGTIASALSFLYKPLSDKYGRKIFLIINTLGMGIGMLLVGISTNIPCMLSVQLLWHFLCLMICKLHIFMKVLHQNIVEKFIQLLRRLQLFVFY